MAMSFNVSEVDNEMVKRAKMVSATAWSCDQVHGQHLQFPAYPSSHPARVCGPVQGELKEARGLVATSKEKEEQHFHTLVWGKASEHHSSEGVRQHRCKVKLASGAVRFWSSGDQSCDRSSLWRFAACSGKVPWLHLPKPQEEIQNQRADARKTLLSCQLATRVRLHQTHLPTKFASSASPESVTGMGVV